jgi:hypothetical protein
MKEQINFGDVHSLTSGLLIVQNTTAYLFPLVWSCMPIHPITNSSATALAMTYNNNPAQMTRPTVAPIKLLYPN